MAKGRKLDFSLPKTPWTPIISHHLELNILSLLKSCLKLAIWKPSVSSFSHITSENSRPTDLPCLLSSCALNSSFFSLMALRCLRPGSLFTWVILVFSMPLALSLCTPSLLLPQGCHPAFLLTMPPQPGTSLVTKPKPFKEPLKSFMNLSSLTSVTSQNPWLDPCELLAVPGWAILSLFLFCIYHPFPLECHLNPVYAQFSCPCSPVLLKRQHEHIPVTLWCQGWFTCSCCFSDTWKPRLFLLVEFLCSCCHIKPYIA